MYTAYDGMVLCATDFSFLELCSFAQSCYTRFKHSVMRDVINAGLDPHRWFAGVMLKVIDPDLSNKDDPEWVASISELLKEKVPGSARQRAKAAKKLALHGVIHVEKKVNCWESGVTVISSQACRWTDRPLQEGSETIPQGSRVAIPEALLLRNE